ncbi:hypothetical protein M153_21068000487, partial [Pseudoloma neurophilia]
MFFFAILLNVKANLDQGSKLIEMQSNKYAFITDLGRAVRVQSNKDDPDSSEAKSVLHLVRKADEKFYIQFSSERFLCVKEDSDKVVSCENETDKNTLWEVVPGDDDGYALKTIDNKCLRIGAFDNKKFSKGLRLKVVKCKKTLDYKWRIKDFLLDSNEYEGG